MKWTRPQTEPTPTVRSQTKEGRLVALLVSVDVPLSCAAQAVGVEAYRLRALLEDPHALALVELDRLAIVLGLAWGRWYARRGLGRLDYREDEAGAALLAALGGDPTALYEVEV